MEEFRTVATPEGLGIYDHMDPAYTVFQPIEKTFSVLWTPFHPDYQTFRAAYRRDVATYGTASAWSPQGSRPENTFDVSMVPWMSFSAFHLAAETERPYLLPIFTLGKWTYQGDVRVLPLTVQIHPGVCDPFHVHQLKEKIEKAMDGLLRG